jgi:hypothetical protein
MSEDPAPYTATPVYFKAHLATPADPTEKVRSPWQGIVVWTQECVPIPQVAIVPTQGLLSKS